jgi:hypothetical protein
MNMTDWLLGLDKLSIPSKRLASIRIMPTESEWKAFDRLLKRYWMISTSLYEYERLPDPLDALR